MRITQDALDLRASRPVLRIGAISITPVDNDTVCIRRFGYSGHDVFGDVLEDEDYEVTVRTVRE